MPTKETVCRMKLFRGLAVRKTLFLYGKNRDPNNGSKGEIWAQL